MRKRFMKGQDGIAMPVAIFMVVVVGIMGAGFLTFVISDLGTAAENNRGQNAFGLADAGRLAAERELSEWTERCAINDNCDDPSADSNLAPWLAGATLSFSSGDVPGSADVKIEAGPGGAGGDRTFTVDSTGNFGSLAPTGSRSNSRRVEAAYAFDSPSPEFPISHDLGPDPDSPFSMPMMYFTFNDRNDSIDIRSNARIHRMSVFAMGGAKVQSGHQFLGEDAFYGNWKNAFNATARPTATPGIGVICRIEDQTLVGSRDFDGGNVLPDVCGGPGHGGKDDKGDKDDKGGKDDEDDGDDSTETASVELVDTPNVPQGSEQITYPFDRSQLTGEADEARMAYLRTKAQEQGTYVTQTDTKDIIQNVDGTWQIRNWPEDSTYDTVVYIKLTSLNDGKPRPIWWNVSSSIPCDESAPKKGILVVENGHLEIYSNKALFSGITITRGAREGEHDDAFNGSAQASCWEGPVNTDGETTISGKMGFFTSFMANPEDIYGSPGAGEDGEDTGGGGDDTGGDADSGVGGVQLQSWREVYSAD